MTELPIEPDARHWDLVVEIDEFGTGLTKWEIDLIEDLLVKSEDGNFPLSEAQKDKIEQIAEQKL